MNGKVLVAAQVPTRNCSFGETSLLGVSLHWVNQQPVPEPGGWADGFGVEEDRMEHLEEAGWRLSKSRRQHRPLHTAPPTALWELPLENCPWEAKPLGGFCSLLWSPQFVDILGRWERQRIGSQELRFHGQMSWLVGQESEGFGVLPLAAIHRALTNSGLCVSLSRGCRQLVGKESVGLAPAGACCSLV